MAILGSLTRLRKVQKTLMSNIYIIIFFLCIVCAKVNTQEYKDVERTEDRIQELISIIVTNLQGTSVCEQFMEEQKIWEAYRAAHIETLFPDYINGIKMEWGSIVTYEISKIILTMNIDRIKVLESFLNDKRNTGTDGKGIYKEYVNELRLMQAK